MGTMIMVFFQVVRAIARSDLGRKQLDKIRDQSPELAAAIEFAIVGSWEEFTEIINRYDGLLSELAAGILSSSSDGKQVASHIQAPKNLHEERSAEVAALLRAAYCVGQFCGCDLLLPVPLGSNGAIAFLPTGKKDDSDVPVPLRDGVRVDTSSIGLALLVPETDRTADELFSSYVVQLESHMVNDGPPFLIDEVTDGIQGRYFNRSWDLSVCMVKTITSQRLETTVTLPAPFATSIQVPENISKRHSEATERAKALTVDANGYITPPDGTAEFFRAGTQRLSEVVSACGFDVKDVPEIASTARE